MINRFFSWFFGWLDSVCEKIEDVATFDVGQENKKKKKKKKR
jgi:hypothetical protein